MNSHWKSSWCMLGSKSPLGSEFQTTVLSYGWPSSWVLVSFSFSHFTPYRGRLLLLRFFHFFVFWWCCLFAFCKNPSFFCAVVLGFSLSFGWDGDWWKMYLFLNEEGSMNWGGQFMNNVKCTVNHLAACSLWVYASVKVKNILACAHKVWTPMLANRGLVLKGNILQLCPFPSEQVLQGIPSCLRCLQPWTSALVPEQQVSLGYMGGGHFSGLWSSSILGCSIAYFQRAASWWQLPAVV